MLIVLVERVIVCLSTLLFACKDRALHLKHVYGFLWFLYALWYSLKCSPLAKDMRNGKSDNVSLSVGSRVACVSPMQANDSCDRCTQKACRHVYISAHVRTPSNCRIDQEVSRSVMIPNWFVVTHDSQVPSVEFASSELHDLSIPCFQETVGFQHVNRHVTDVMITWIGGVVEQTCRELLAWKKHNCKS